MSNTAFNYSKWDKIELSDDESDLHPNIDKDSWFRLKHRTRLEREEKEDAEIKTFNDHTKQDQARLAILNARIKAVEAGEGGADAEFEDIESLKVEVTEINQTIDARNKRIEEINERRKWNIDNICQVTEEKTVVNKKEAVSLQADIPLTDRNEKPPPTETVFTGTSSTAAASATATAPAPAAKAASSAPGAASTPAVKASAAASTTTTTTAAAKDKAHLPAEPEKAREKMAVISYNDYVIKHEALLEQYSEISDMEATKNFLFKNCDVLLHEHAQSYMLLSCLEDEMNGKKTRMKLVCRQSQILSHIQELGTSMKRDPRDVILPFFARIEDKQYFQGFSSAIDEFTKRIQKRAIEKRKEMDAEDAVRGAPMGPGGLDPMEVFESLPIAMQEAFEAQDTAKLQATLAAMDPFEAKKCMKKCVDSGLWVPQDASIFEGDEENGLEEIVEEAEEEID